MASPLIGKISAVDPEIDIENKKIEIEWDALQKNGDAKIWLATTNNFKSGGEDSYTLITSVSLKKEKAEIDISKFPSGFYKIVIETPSNFLNRWVILDKALLPGR
jgi:hypothetical protein